MRPLEILTCQVGLKILKKNYIDGSYNHLM